MGNENYLIKKKFEDTDTILKAIGLDLMKLMIEYDELKKRVNDLEEKHKIGSFHTMGDLI